MKFSFLLLIFILLGIICSEDDDVLAWYKKYPNPHVSVLTDEYHLIHIWIKPKVFHVFIIDETMYLFNYTNQGLTEAFFYLTGTKK